MNAYILLGVLRQGIHRIQHDSTLGTKKNEEKYSLYTIFYSNKVVHLVSHIASTNNNRSVISGEGKKIKGGSMGQPMQSKHFSSCLAEKQHLLLPLLRINLVARVLAAGAKTARIDLSAGSCGGFKHSNFCLLIFCCSCCDPDNKLTVPLEINASCTEER